MNPTPLRFILLALLVAALATTGGWFSLASAQDARAGAGRSGAATERAAVELKRGMTLAEVQKLLGKPWRTTLSDSGSPEGPGTLRWTYTGMSRAAASEPNLNVDFNARTAEEWTVSGWGWSSY